MAQEKKNQLHSSSFGKMTSMGALVPPELQWVGKVDSGVCFFFFWAWDFPEGGVGDQQCGGVK